jgi:hypothetical protein
MATYQIYARTAAGIVPVGGPTPAPRWRADAMVGLLLERADVLTAWHARVTP